MRFNFLLQTLNYNHVHSICFSISKIHSRLIFTVLSACRCNTFRPYLSRPVQGSAYTRVGLYASIYGNNFDVANKVQLNAQLPYSRP